MTSYGNLASKLSKDEVLIKVCSTDDSIGSSDIDKVLKTSFDDGTKGIYFLSLKNRVRVWVTWKEKKEEI